MKSVTLGSFLASTETHLGSSYASRLLSAYNIHFGMDASLFWTKLTYFMGDIMFSEPTHKVAVALGPPSNKKIVYRYTQTQRNPSQGSPLHQMPGHHFVESLFLFQTLMERFPSRKLRDLSDAYGRRWIKFAAGDEPWEEYRLDDGAEEGKIMVINGRTGFEIRSRRDVNGRVRFVRKGREGIGGGKWLLR
jgi:hypothetical protein